MKKTPENYIFAETLKSFVKLFVKQPISRTYYCHFIKKSPSFKKTIERLKVQRKILYPILSA